MTKAELIQQIKWNIKPEDRILSYHVNTIVNMMIDEMKKAIIGKQKLVIPGFITFHSKVVDEKIGIFLGKSFHCDKKMAGTVKFSKVFQKKIKENSKVI